MADYYYEVEEIHKNKHMVRLNTYPQSYVGSNPTGGTNERATMATDRVQSKLKLTVTEVEELDNGMAQRVVAEADSIRLEFVNYANAFVGWRAREGEFLELDGFSFTGYVEGEPLSPWAVGKTGDSLVK